MYTTGHYAQSFAFSYENLLKLYSNLSHLYFSRVLNKTRWFESHRVDLDSKALSANMTHTLRFLFINFEGIFELNDTCSSLIWNRPNKIVRLWVCQTNLGFLFSPSVVSKVHKAVLGFDMIFQAALDITL